MIHALPPYQVKGADGDATIRITVKFGGWVLAYAYLSAELPFWAEITGRHFVSRGDLHSVPLIGYELIFEWIGPFLPTPEGGS